MMLVKVEDCTNTQKQTDCQKKKNPCKRFDLGLIKMATIDPCCHRDLELDSG